MLPDRCFINKIGLKIVLFQEKQFCERGALLINSIKLCKEKPTLFQDEDKLLYYEDWVYIPPNKKLREQLLNDNHDAPIARHPGVFKTYELINHHYWWPSQLKDIKMYVKGCSTCQQNKALRQKKAAPLNPHRLPESPWESILLDVIGPSYQSSTGSQKWFALFQQPQSYRQRDWSIYTWNKSGSCMESLRRSPAIEVLSLHQSLWRNSAHG